ncbi:hypothetical protein K4L06_00915 [Lysobacter sp. BMK333-48F3]|uniref:hypothetical protein n=1 Tax=Lysobacter sp. BMK333-48F3 TaxID=2867962 RepID=UPI001C8B2AEF|nr:hypothetical protein [Lysobacter sp. BMK333-48F3]MBX9399854.1 hypothetical protein [Lysobacter sp. BMK333-48F3]
MKLVVDGVQESFSSVTFSELAHFDSDPQGACSYELHLTEGCFVDVFDSIYNECIDELVRDDVIVGKFNPPYEGAVGYPTLYEFLRLPESSRMEMVRAFFVFDVLGIFFAEDKMTADARWFITSLESILLREEDVVISGRVLAR